MVKVNELPPKTAQETYEIFRNLRESFGSKEFNFVLFYGNPTDTEISWCPDCRGVHVDFMRFATNYGGTARFNTVPVGSREEFNSDNPFVRYVPHLEAVPTLAIYGDRIVYLKLVDPTFEDLAYFVKKYKL
ncbi:MAG: thioredoxin domain-containing protein [Candidatus Bathyarchaeia archaeon]